MARYDFIIKGGRYFDGTGALSFTRNLAIKDGRVVRVTADPIADDDAERVIDASGLWVMPGFLDTHTHYDAELLVSPSLSESVRHGVTTVLVGSCSLSMVCSDYEDASDIFTRVETVPRERVLPILKAHKTRPTGSVWMRARFVKGTAPMLWLLIRRGSIRTLSRCTGARWKTLICSVWSIAIPAL